MPSNDWKLELQKVAAVEDPKNLLPTVRLWHTENTVAIFDKFPKSKYHFLLLPRLTTYWTTWRLHSLRGLFRGDKEAGRNLLLELKDESEQVVKMMKDEMLSKYGTTWKIWRGFHAIPSMEHIHLHIMSADLVSDHLNNRKRYNSFHPTLGFFLDLDEVLDWYNLPDAEFKKKTLLPIDRYKSLLREPLRSWRTGEYYDTLPKLKAELDREWRKDISKASTPAKRRREKTPPRVEDEGSETEDDDDDDNEPPTKRAK